MPVTATQVSSLRSRTGVSILACKTALEEAAGDEEKAIEILRKRGEADRVKKSAREQHEGAIFSAQAPGKAVLLLLGCETDFVARNEDFRSFGQRLAGVLLAKGGVEAKAEADRGLSQMVQKLGENLSLVEVNEVAAPVIGVYVHPSLSSGQASKIGVIIGLQGGTAEIARDLAMHAAAMNPKVVAPSDVSPPLVEKEKEIWREQLKKEGKPEAIWDKIMMGKEKKFREEQALLTQPFAKDQTKKVKDMLGQAKVTAYARLAVGE